MKQPRFVGKHHARHHSTRLPVDDATDGFDDTFLVINRIIIEAQFHFRHVLQGFVHVAILAGEGKQLILGHGEIDIHIRIVADRSKRIGHIGTYQCACTIRQCTYDSVTGTFHFGIREIVAGTDLLGFGLRQLSFGGEIRILGRFQAEFRNYFLCIQFFVALVGQFGSTQCGTCCFHIGSGGFQCGLVRHLVDNEKRLPAAYFLPFGHTEFLNRSRHLRININILSPTYARRIGRRKFLIHRFYLHYCIRRRFHSRIRCLLARCHPHCTTDNPYQPYPFFAYCNHTFSFGLLLNPGQK